MDKAPERLWVQPENRTPVDEDPRHAGPHDVEYVRADLYEQVKRERDDAKQALQNEIVAHGNTIRGKAERLDGARVKVGPLAHVIAEMLERAGEARPNGDILHDILAQAVPAALAEPAGDAEPLSAQIERLASFIMEHVPGEPSQSEGAVDCAIRIIRNSLTTPPASAIREVLPATGPYVDRLIRIFRDRPDDDTSAIVLQDYARASLGCGGDDA